MASLGDLELVIQSRYPFIAVETAEEDRLETTLSQVAGDLRVPFFVWTLTNGLHRFGLPNALYDSQQPLKALRDHRRGTEGDEAALGHARGDDLRPARVGARPDGHGELGA